MMGMGGSYEEPSICHLFSHFAAEGFTTVKFNFRGAGKSGGRQSLNGLGEQEDLRTVVEYVRNIEHPPKKIILIGNSFGSMVVCATADEFPDVISFIAIGFPYSVLWFLSMFHGKEIAEKAAKSKKMKFFLIGDKDNFTSIKKFKSFIETTDKETTRYHIEQGMNHFWVNQYHVMIRHINKFLIENIEGMSQFLTLDE
ncbi:alpha/beta-hydrolase [Neocallimastix californiae]|uniref:Alpha/beta-hydrolase n=1 Tax=Neocallimastix californiae TaxID=1754190 RepID=A0A1Y2DE13_9FUNG|nr:alpha/beta-hydrolase [Neocallimastix californiae]|eukprot:ORY57366.1 alpha/beta-hydrolase [Neocallimastix californiae]